MPEASVSATPLAVNALIIFPAEVNIPLSISSEVSSLRVPSIVKYPDFTQSEFSFFSAMSLAIVISAPSFMPFFSPYPASSNIASILLITFGKTVPKRRSKFFSCSEVV